MSEFLLALSIFAGTLTAALAGYFWYQGDSDIVFETQSTRDFKIEHNPSKQEVYCRCLIPLANRGRQNGMIINVFCQPMYCGRIMERLEILPCLRLYQEPLRKNGYWEAVIIKKNTTHLTEMSVKIRYNTDFNYLLKEVPCLTVVIHYQTIGRSGIQWRLAEIKFNLIKLNQKIKGEIYVYRSNSLAHENYYPRG